MASSCCDRLTVAWVRGGRCRNLKEVGWTQCGERVFVSLLPLSTCQNGCMGEQGKGVKLCGSEPPTEYQSCAHPIACPVQSTCFYQHNLPSTFFTGNQITLAEAGWEATPQVGLEQESGRGKGYGELAAGTELPTVPAASPPASYGQPSCWPCHSKPASPAG